MPKGAKTATQTKAKKASQIAETPKVEKGKASKKEPERSPLDMAQQIVEEIGNNLAVLYDPDATLAERIAKVTKAIYDYAQKEEPKQLRVMGALDELLVDGFESEQIWEELRMHSDSFLPKADAILKALLDKLAEAERLAQKRAEAEAEDENDDDEENDFALGEEDDEGFYGFNEDDEEEDDFEIPEGYEIASDNEFDEDAEDAMSAPSSKQKKQKAIIKRKKTSEIDDEFFSLEEMERFADLADASDAVMAAQKSGKVDPSVKAAEDRAQKELAALVAMYRRQAGEDEEDDESDPLGLGQDIDLTVDPGDGRDIMYDDFFLPVAGNEDGEEDEDQEEEDNEWDEETRAFLEAEEEKTSKKLQSKSKSKSHEENEEEEEQGEEEDAGEEDEADEPLEAKDGTEFKSSFELQQEKLRAQTEAIEKLLVAPKAWDLTGESLARDRTKDALLEKYLEVEYATKMAEPITEEISMQIEEIIRSRCRDGAFDDVQPRVQPTIKEFVPQEEVSTEKSKYGLAEIYEQEYMKQALGVDAPPTEAEAMRNRTQVEISKMLAEIFHKLDALSNFTYTPLPATTEMTITSSTPAIEMEEVVPMGVSDSDRVAPQEVYQPKTGGLYADPSEMSHIDKQRALKARREAKAKHFAAKEQEEKLQALAGDKHAAKRQKEKDYKKRYDAATQSKIITKGVESDTTKYGTSTAFFRRMQENEQIGQARKQGAKDDKKSAAAYKS